MTHPPIVPGQQPTWTDPPPKKPPLRVHPLAYLAVIIVGAAVGAGAFFGYRDFAPAGWPGIAIDSGVAACEDLRNGKAESNGSKTFTEQQYREIRDKFAGSDDVDLREQGTRLMDLVWQVSQLDDVQTQAWPYLPQLMERTAGVRSACADHGIILPSN